MNGGNATDVSSLSNCFWMGVLQGNLSSLAISLEPKKKKRRVFVLLVDVIDLTISSLFCLFIYSGVFFFPSLLLGLGEGAGSG